MWHQLAPYFITLLVIMVDICLDAFVLVPSQVVGKHSSTTTCRDSRQQPSATSVLHDTLGADTALAPIKDSIILVEKNDKRKTRRQRRKRPKKKLSKKQLAQETSTETVNASAETNKTSFPTSGNLPDIYWRSVSMEHLRQHPRVKALPKHVTKLDTIEDVRFFRQESWQWEALHDGRCTTSQAVAALGFLEPTAGEVLGISPAWRRGGHGAYHRLSQKALRTLPEMRRALLGKESEDETSESEQITVWKEPSDANDGKYAAHYRTNLDSAQLEQRRKIIHELSRNGDVLERKVRMMWGNTQEATSLLTAINFFAPQGAVFQEVGMCGAGLPLNQSQMESSLLIGATPDGILCFPDGRIEALEVKNHCPFFSNRGRKRHAGKVKRFSIGDRPFSDKDGVFPQYVPQLQMEMYCLGEACRSAVMVRQTATQGALILRMPRDDEWISEMLYWLHRFQRDFVECSQPPSKDFFWNQSIREEQSRYRCFLNATLALRNRVKVVAEIPNKDIQRMEEDTPFFLD